MANKYKAGDIVCVQLTEIEADMLNDGDGVCLYTTQETIIAHTPAPETAVRWVNVYRGDTFEHESLESAIRNRSNSGIDYLFTARLEWPDGDTSKDPIVTVEDA